MGETVTFWVNGVQADQTDGYDPGTNTNLNLTFAGAIVDISVELQGDDRPDPAGWEIPITIAVNMGTLLEGDANDDNIIDLLDFSILASGWLSLEGEPSFDRTDFDHNETINLSDLLLLTTNWLESLPIEVP